MNKHEFIRESICLYMVIGGECWFGGHCFDHIWSLEERSNRWSLFRNALLNKLFLSGMSFINIQWVGYWPGQSTGVTMFMRGQPGLAPRGNNQINRLSVSIVILLLHCAFKTLLITQFSVLQYQNLNVIHEFGKKLLTINSVKSFFNT